MRTADDVLSRVPHRRGHFLFESGHHSALWLELGIGVEALATMENPIWPPDDCPLCARGEPLVQAFR